MPGQRIALIAFHTSPLHRPGTGDAGGLNVYVLEQAKALVALGCEVHIVTRRTSPEEQPDVMVDGIHVHHIEAGPVAPVAKEDLPQHLEAFTAAADTALPHTLDAIHAHYWLSAVAAKPLAASRQATFAVTMHTLAAVKNEAAAGTDSPEPEHRVRAERDILLSADLVTVNTPEEQRDIERLYGVSGSHVKVVPPGVDVSVFAPLPAATRSAQRAQRGWPEHAVVALFVGRIQRFKGPDLALAAIEHARNHQLPSATSLRLVINGGSSGQGSVTRDHLAASAHDLGLCDEADPIVQFVDPVPRHELATMYACADIVVVPSIHETFGLVAVEAAACGTPVVATDAGGLRHSVRNSVTGDLVPERTPEAWANALTTLAADTTRRGHYGTAGVTHARALSWQAGAKKLLTYYAELAPSTQASMVETWARSAFNHGDVLDAQPGQRGGEWVVVVKGQAKHQITVSVLVGQHTTSVTTFVMRAPENNVEAVHRKILAWNRRLPGISFNIDVSGDIYLKGVLPSEVCTDAAFDALIGAIVQTADDSFNPLVALGFEQGIRTEWAWRKKRGLPTDNLKAFQHVVKNTPTASS